MRQSGIVAVSLTEAQTCVAQMLFPVLLYTEDAAEAAMSPLTAAEENLSPSLALR
jgi:hypothetical protein